MEVKLVLAFLLVMICASPITAESCVTTRGILGECIAWNACNPFIELISRSSFKSLNRREKTKLLLLWKCGKGTSVCCPNDEPYSEPPPSVESHRNLQLLPSLQECGSSSIDRIYGGNQTNLFGYPWMALISAQTADGRKEFTCAGTVINSRYILTAAHCITKLNHLQLIGVRLGEWDKSTQVDCSEDYCAPPVQDIAIEEILPHPGYIGLVSGRNIDLRNDIGLLRLAEPIDLTVDNVMPICLPTTIQMREAKLENEELILTGWGRSNILDDGSVTTTKDFSNPRLSQITVRIVSNRDCAEKYNSSGKGGIGFRGLCVSGLEGVSSCIGDSGGPMGFHMALKKKQIKFVQFGVVCAGYKNCGIKDQPSILTNVVYYMDWILDTLRP